MDWTQLLTQKPKLMGYGFLIYIFYSFCFSMIDVDNPAHTYPQQLLHIKNLLCSADVQLRYNNRKKSFWRLFYVGMLGLLLISLGCSVIFFMASYKNYPSGYAIKRLHQAGHSDHSMSEIFVHIDTFSAMNGITRFCENDHPWSPWLLPCRYSKEEGILLDELQFRNFTYLLNEHPRIDGFKCLFKTYGFSRIRLRKCIPPTEVVTEPKVFVHGALSNEYVMSRNWPGCS
ncbi:Dol-P-Man:Man(7)GlcNAc(2)-PP-Dol alpha-1,6-mannosyltransferase-like protein [Drosera capensis]